MTAKGYTRWDPKTRAGAIAIRANGRYDLKAVESISEHVMDWARYQEIVGEHDSVETSPVRGSYDWRGYLQEETQAARRRDEQTKPREKKAERAAPPPAPSVFYG